MNVKKPPSTTTATIMSLGTDQSPSLAGTYLLGEVDMRPRSWRVRPPGSTPSPLRSAF